MINIFNKSKINLSENIDNAILTPSPARGDEKRGNSLAASLLSHLAAFTLAEVLITLGIIGVVAAMTMPTLIANYRQQVAVSKLKKMYSTLSQAMLFTIQKEGDYSSLDVEDQNLESIKVWYNTALKPYIKITDECINKAGCWAEKGAKNLDGTTPQWDNGKVGIGGDIIVFNTVDGYSVNIDAYNGGAGIFGVNMSNSACLVAHVDINGKKLPNVIGKDIFVFVFAPEKGFVPAGKDLSDDEINANCNKNGNGRYCFEKIMRNGWNIDKDNLW